MRKFKYLVGLILIMIFFNFELAKVNAQSVEYLTLEITLDKDTFLTQEPIWVNLYFTNLGDRNVILDCLDLCWQKLRVYLVNLKGDTLEYCGYIAEGTCVAGPTVRPSERYHYYISLSENFGKGAHEYLPPSLRYFEEDTYTLQVAHSGVVSNLIKFNVKNPKGQERGAYNLVKKASRNAFNYYHKENQQAIGFFQELINKYPKSAYADLAYSEIAGLYGLLGRADKTSEYLKNLILNYPNSHFALKSFPGLLQQMAKDEKIKFLKEVIKKQPKTKASDWSENSLKAIQAKEEKEK